MAARRKRGYAHPLAEPAACSRRDAPAVDKRVHPAKRPTARDRDPSGEPRVRTPLGHPTQSDPQAVRRPAQAPLIAHHCLLTPVAEGVLVAELPVAGGRTRRRRRDVAAPCAAGRLEEDGPLALGGSAVGRRSRELWLIEVEA